MAHVLEYLNKAEETVVLQNSPERVVNSTLRVLETVSTLPPTVQRLLGEELSELVDINEQDWREIKSTIYKLWNNARDELFRRDGGMKTPGMKYPALPKA